MTSSCNWDWYVFDFAENNYIDYDEFCGIVDKYSAESTADQLREAFQVSKYLTSTTNPPQGPVSI